MNITTNASFPLGLNFNGDFINFSLHAPLAKTCALLIYSKTGALQETIPLTDKSGSIWHISLPFLKYANLDYLYLIDEKFHVLDPYAKILNTSSIWGSGARPKETKGVILKINDFDWENTKPPNYLIKDLIIYEMHVRSFTIKADVKNPGTFLGIIEKIPHLKALGINAIELMPIHEFNECENPNTGLFNFWGYSPIAYFAFMQRYGSGKSVVLDEFKTLVKALHKEKIAIIIDVVYNHTGEGGKNSHCYHFKNLDPNYYIHDQHGHYIDYSGCGNTLDANNSPGCNLILDSLRFLADDCQVDGFRFDLASTFFRDAHGTIKNPKIIDLIQKDPILSKKILIAEAWDAKGLYQVGKFPKPFADWNGAYRDRVRSFINQVHHSKGAFADALSGSFNLYHEKTPDMSINFVTAHDGFTIYDLFSYNHKHNLANQEHNNDGSNHNISRNWGHEGPTEDSNIIATRQKLINLSFAILFLSLGTPMMLMGDEYGHSRNGNNNAYCQDNDLNYFLWDKVDNTQISYINRCIQLRNQIPRLSSAVFYNKNEISWHGAKFNTPAWESDDGFLAMHIHAGFLIVINCSAQSKNLMIPKGSWLEIFNSEYKTESKSSLIDNSHYMINAHTLSVLKAK